MARRRGPPSGWDKLPFERLLDLRLCDLGLRIEGTWLEECIERLYEELDARGIVLAPRCWLSDEWFSPTRVPGIAIPFYLAHPRLVALERRQMYEVEGGTRRECMQLLRHETGHALQVAYQLHRRRRWQQIFGRSSEPYPDHYRPNPASKHYVLHLDAWYAQSHPDEDFAETFAVWLRPRSDWRRQYAHWPALRKLEYVDGLVRELADQRPLVRGRRTPHSLPQLRLTLRSYYEAKRERYYVGYPRSYDRDLQRLFVSSREAPGGETAAAFLRRNRRELRELVSRWTGEYQFTVDQVLKEMIGSCRALKLRAVGPKGPLKLECAILLTVHALQCLRRKEWHPL
jgi:hypothetical protein